MSEPKDKIRRGWAERLLSTGRVAGSAAKLAARQIAGAGDTGGAIGEALAAELDQMKGVAMKVGQILSYFDGVLPEETHQALRKLQTGSEPAAYEVIAGVVEEAFGLPPERAFERFDPAPIAAASIGQVHRARFDGREVAVKVQYPGVRDTMVADVSRLRAFSRIASAATAVDGPAIVAELAERFYQECDYELEANNQNAFRRAFAGAPELRIPEAIRERTRSAVLTSEWCEGRGFYDLIENASAEEKNRAALLIVRFALRCLFSARVINADPHPGNYLFQRDGAVVFLDFGCVRRFESEFIERERALARVVVEGRRESFRDAVLATGMVPKERGFDYDIHWRMLRHQYAPYLEPTFHFTPEYLREGNDFSRPTNPNLRRLAIPPQWIWVQRQLWGMHAVLTRLDAEGAFRTELLEALDQRLDV